MLFMTPTVPDPSVRFEDPVPVRRTARVISLALGAGVIAFFLYLYTTVPEGGDGSALRHSLYQPAVWVCAGLVIVATLIGTRMHTFRGTLNERIRKTLTTHVTTLALCEMAAVLGLALIFITKSWDAKLPAVLGALGIVMCAMRGELRFSALVDEYRAVHA